MPKILISEADFRSLSTPTQRELWELFQKSFSLENRDPSATDVALTEVFKRVKEGSKRREHESDWMERRRANRLSSVNYQEYNAALHQLHKALPNILPQPSSFRFEALSVEMAIAVVLGLSPDSIKVILCLIKGPVARKELAAVLNGEGRINGTIGSINRRLAKRFDENFYGESLKLAKLIDFDKEYFLRCDGRSIEIALKILKAGYKIGKGNILLKFKDTFGKGTDQIIETIKIEEEAIIFADSGLGFTRKVSWDYELEKQQRSYSYDVAMTVPSATVVIDAPDGDEWVSDEPDVTHLFDKWHPSSSPDEISFDGKSPKKENKSE